MAIPKPPKTPFDKINIFFSDKKLVLLSFFIFLIALPPLNFGVSTSFVSKIILLIISLLIILEKVTLNKTEGGGKVSYRNELIGILALFLVPATISVLKTNNISAYLQVYQNIIFSLIFLYIIQETLNKKNDIELIIFIFIIIGFINALAEFFIYYNPAIFPGLFKSILDPGLVNSIYYYLDRGKGTYDTFLQLLIPLILYFLINKKTNLLVMIFLSSYLLLIVVTSTISNLRTYFLMAVFALIGSIFIFGRIFIKKISPKLFLSLIFCIILSIGTISFINKRTPIYVFDKLILAAPEDVGTINFRFDQWEKTIEIGKAYPLTGVGLGNFPEYTDSSNERNAWMDIIARKGNPPSYYYPHNLFFNTLAETGFTGLVCILILMAYFIKTDALILFEKNLLKKALVISFWTLILYAMFNPTNLFKFWIYFFLIRSLIYKLENYHAIRN